MAESVRIRRLGDGGGVDGDFKRTLDGEISLMVAADDF
jgi:hypothetical protein